jgi:hypothetical protein
MHPGMHPGIQLTADQFHDCHFALELFLLVSKGVDQNALQARQKHVCGLIQQISDVVSIIAADATIIDIRLGAEGSVT